MNEWFSGDAMYSRSKSQSRRVNTKRCAFNVSAVRGGYQSMTHMTLTAHMRRQQQTQTRRQQLITKTKRTIWDRRQIYGVYNTRSK